MSLFADHNLPFAIALGLMALLFLLLFALLGLGIQALATDLTGNPLYHLLAAVFAGGAALPATSVLVRPIGRLMPKDETSAVGLDSLVGRRATITTGRAAVG